MTLLLLDGAELLKACGAFYQLVRKVCSKQANVVLQSEFLYSVPVTHMLKNKCHVKKILTYPWKVNFES